MRPAARSGLILGLLILALSAGPGSSQPLDCGRLAAEISALDSGGQRQSNHYGGAVQKQRAELDRAIQSARALGCNRGQFLMFDTAPPQCHGLNAQIQQLQASLSQYNGIGDLGGNTAARQQLVARYNAYCRGQTQAAAAPQGQPQPRNFFDALFGIFTPHPNPAEQPHFEEVRPEPGEDLRPHGGSQVVCVRSCDGGFFPLSLTVGQSQPDQLAGLCQALCPNVPVSVYTRSPNQEIRTAVSLEGDAPYTDLPNALKFQKSFDAACTCKPPGKSWAEALAGADDLLGRARKTDIVVTPENSVELAKPKFEKAQPPQAADPSAGAETSNGDHPAMTPGGQDATEEVTGPDGVKRRVRIIAPRL